MEKTLTLKEAQFIKENDTLEIAVRNEWTGAMEYADLDKKDVLELKEFLEKHFS